MAEGSIRNGKIGPFLSTLVLFFDRNTSKFATSCPFSMIWSLTICNVYTLDWPLRDVFDTIVRLFFTNRF